MIRKKVAFSICLVTIISILSVSAFASSLKTPTVQTVYRGTERIPLDIVSTVEQITTEAPTNELAETPYQSHIASMDWDAEESYLLAKIAMAEAEGEDTEGKALVMLVVLNRVWDDKFPDTIEEVIYQPKQFSPVANGRFDRVEPNADCWAALDMIMLDKWDESGGATYFESKGESTWHREHLDFLFRHGGHYFYADKGE